MRGAAQRRALATGPVQGRNQAASESIQMAAMIALGSMVALQHRFGRACKGTLCPYFRTGNGELAKPAR